jgi:cation diffusion facilitator CzcD-associated flavoprotein CzcO
MKLDVAVVGAGPYGLSIAAHLASRDVNCRIFGRPMESWRERMPEDMLLKSDGFASNLSSPDPYYSLKSFCELHGISYDDTQLPVSLETFVQYGLWFQKHLVPKVDERKIVRIQRGDGNFVLSTADGDQFEARRVVLAVGISEFSWVPPEFSHLPAQLVTHSSQHRTGTNLAGKGVAVIGGGASAIDLAALLHAQGADLCILARRSEIAFHEPPSPDKQTFRQKLRNPPSGLGPGWKSRIFTEVPYLFRYLPAKLRMKIVREHLGPAPGWRMREPVMGKVLMYLGVRALTATVREGRVQLLFLDGNCHRVERMVDHVIAATGYRPDVSRLTFLSQSIRQSLRTLADAPVLSSRFESSVPGLYFVGLASAYTFGPMMRFAFGAGYTSRVLAGHLQRTSNRRIAKVLEYPEGIVDPVGSNLSLDPQEKAG